MRDPAKKKHATKPRPPAIVRLTPEQQSAKAGASVEVARAHLAEAERIEALGVAPMACVHSAYYAMHHCAVAMLLVTGGADKYGDVPGSHVHVVEHFAQRIAMEAPDLTALAASLRNGLADRTMGDYGRAGTITSVTATELTKRAALFLAACEERWPSLAAKQ